MRLAQTLIDKAVEMCGSQAELARRMGVYPTDITKLKSGDRPLSPEIAAELADIAGEDARNAAIEAIIERNAANRKGHMLKEILGKALAAGVAAMCLFSYSEDSVSATKTIAKPLDTLYIVSSSIGRAAGRYPVLQQPPKLVPGAITTASSVTPA